MTFPDDDDNKLTAADDAIPPDADGASPMDPPFGFWEDDPQTDPVGVAVDHIAASLATSPLRHAALPPAPSYTASLPRATTERTSAADALPTAQPAEISYEKAVIGSCLNEDQAVNVAMEKLKAEDFYDPRHAEAFISIGRLAMANRPVNAHTVYTDLVHRLKDNNPVGIAYLVDLAADPASLPTVEHYATHLLKLARVRRILDATHKVHRKGYERGVDPDEFVNLAEGWISEAFSSVVRHGPQRIGEVIPAVRQDVHVAREQGGQGTGLPSGFIDIDYKHLGGLHRSDMIVLGARPAMGKSAFALNVAVNVAAGKCRSDGGRGRVAVFSLEMGRKQLVMRMLSSYSSIKLSDLRLGKLGLQDEIRLRDTCAEMSDMELYLDDTPGLTVGELRARCKRIAMNGPIDLIVVDYLQLMRGSGGAKQSREQEIGEISRSLKGLAKDLECTVLALSQLNRSLEKTDDKGKGGTKRKPQMSDLRESGSIEQDADIIWFIHRDAYYQETPDNKNHAELIVAKHRAGSTGSIHLSFSGEHTLFGDFTDRVDDGFSHGSPDE